MSVRFVIGRAGSGKTDHCLDAIRRSLMASPVEGPALILLVPEQAALQTERALIDAPDLGGSHRAQVCGFRRLATRILDDLGDAAAQALTANGRAMTLRYLVAGLTERLQYYRRVERLTGFIDSLARAIGELFEEAVTPDDLLQASQAVTDDPLRSRKLADLHLIYSAYIQHLGDDRLDPSQHLEMARKRLARCRWLHAAELCVDGFAGFTRQEMLMLVELARFARRLEITALIDPDVATRARSSTLGSPADDAELFAKPLRTYLRLHDAFVEHAVEIEPPLFLQPDRSVRFGSAPQLEMLEGNLFSADVGVAKPDQPDAPLQEALPSVQLVELPDRRLEVDYAVSRICQWVHCSADPLRYRDIALIVRDLQPYADLLSAALAERNIPFFIDRRRPTAHHPLVELLRSLVLMAAESMSVESARLALKTGLLGIDDEAADELENFILAHGIAGLDLWTGGDWSPVPPDIRVGPFDKELPEPSSAERRRMERVNATRRALLERLGNWLTFARSAGRADGRTWSVQLALTLQDALSVPRQLACWADQAAEGGDLDAAEEHRQIWRDTVAFVDDLADALGQQPMTIRELADVVEAGLSQFTLGLAPPMLDQVLVGAVERSRHPDIRAAVILGFNDGVFPSAGSEDAILNDEDRTFLADRGLPVGTPRRQRILEERLLAYVAFTRASRSLVVTYPVADEQGRPLRVSPFADDLRAACPQLSELHIDDPARTRSMWRLMSSADLAAALVLELQSRPPLHDDDAASRARWNVLYEYVRTHDELRLSLARTCGALDNLSDARLSPEAVARLYPGPFKGSVSRLESFAACPFRHFAEYGLRLQERQTAELQPVDVGKLHHAILEDFIGRLVEGGRPLGQLDDPDVLRQLQDSCDRVEIRPPLAGALSTAREAYQARRSREDLARVVRAQRDVAALGRFRPKGAEVPFGFDRPGSLPALEIDTPAGRRVRLRGYIDRVDLAELADEMLGIAVDYKRYARGKRLDLSQVYYGLSLQLLGYLLVLAQNGKTLAGRPIRPVGAFYVGLVPAYRSVEHPDDYDQAKHSPLQTHRPQGLLDLASMDALETGYQGGASAGFNVRTKDGKIQYADRSDASDSAGFNALLEHTRFQLGHLADGILNGDVSVAPYRLKDFSPCGWCPFRSVCRFEFGQPGLRLLDTLSKSQIIARLTAGARERVK
ncbi:MAG: PD-(D/E)XK nuclease family protein [Planctomycetota bacterium]|jgi:ATP-dependent helicase/nuclease subunit B